MVILKQPCSDQFDPKHLKLLEEIDQGGFGCVHSATYRNVPVVVKTSLKGGDEDESVAREHGNLLLMQPSGFTGIPKVGSRFTMDGREGFVMERLGTDLLKLLGKTPDRKFSLKTTLMIGIQVIKRLKSVHSCGLVHNDVKPNNLMTGPRPNTVYLIDFGIARSYVEGGRHVERRKTRKMKGTKKYCSVGTMRGRTSSRRDDLESLAYVLVRLNTGKLPWDAILKDQTRSKKEMMREVVRSKRQEAGEICRGTCREFAVFLERVRSLGFSEKPDYDGYCEMFEKLLKRKGFNADSPFVWD